MKKITIEKYTGGKLTESFHVPVALLKMAGTLLPRAALEAMREKGIHIEEILFACKGKDDYTRVIEVQENGIDTEVRILVA